MVHIGTNAPSCPGRQSLSMSREAVPSSNRCIRVGTACDHGISAVRLTLQWTAGMRKYRPFADGSANASKRPFSALQDRPYEWAVTARKRRRLKA